MWNRPCDASEKGRSTCIFDIRRTYSATSFELLNFFNLDSYNFYSGLRFCTDLVTRLHNCYISLSVDND